MSDERGVRADSDDIDSVKRVADRVDRLHKRKSDGPSSDEWMTAVEQTESHIPDIIETNRPIRLYVNDEIVGGIRDVTLDSGQRQYFSTGSRRDTRKGKGRYDLISPHAMRRLSRVLERGAQKYGERNWEKGQPLSRYLDSGLRHIFQVLEGHYDEDHAGQALWNLMAFVHTEEAISQGELPESLNDLFDFDDGDDVA